MSQSLPQKKKKATRDCTFTTGRKIIDCCLFNNACLTLRSTVGQRKVLTLDHFLGSSYYVVHANLMLSRLTEVTLLSLMKRMLSLLLSLL